MGGQLDLKTNILFKFCYKLLTPCVLKIFKLLQILKQIFLNFIQICVLRKETKRSSFSATPVGRGSFSAASEQHQHQSDPVAGGVNNVGGGFIDTSNLASLCDSEDSIELRKIKKVQSFFRGWLCRRRWKQIVEEYIKSPHAESMRKRNSLVFSMVEAEEEYLEQLEVKTRGGTLWEFLNFFDEFLMQIFLKFIMCLQKF